MPQFDEGQALPPALDGLEVLDLSSFIAGPLVGRHLAMLGAGVIKIESPSGDPFRAIGPMFSTWNQGKRSIALDLTSTDGQDTLHRLAARADVVVENWRPGVATRLGADATSLRALNPKVVYCSSTGYGADQSMARVPAFDPLLQALGGIMASQGGDAEPVFLTVPVHDVVTPLISAFAIVSGLFHRQRAGHGQVVHTSLAHTTMAVQAAEYTRYVGAPEPIVGGFDFPGPGPSRCWQGEGNDLVFVDGEHQVPICRHGLVNDELAIANGLCTTQDHPTWGEITLFGQLVGGAGPAPARSPLHDEHGDAIRSEL